MRSKPKQGLQVSLLVVGSGIAGAKLPTEVAIAVFGAIFGALVFELIRSRYN
jgi:hypothetical protein